MRVLVKVIEKTFAGGVKWIIRSRMIGDDDLWDKDIHCKHTRELRGQLAN